MAKSDVARAQRGPSRWAWAVLATSLAMGLGVRVAFFQATALADEASPLNDSWKGDKLDPKWHVTLEGDAQANAGDSSVKVENGLLHLTVNSGETFNGGDSGIYLWQPANGDFQVTLEIHNVSFTGDAAKIGIMVRSSLSRFSPNAYGFAMPKGGNLQLRQSDAVIGSADTPTGSGCPSDECVAWGDATAEDPNRPVILQRLTRVGDAFTIDRSYDLGKTWGPVRTGSLAGRDKGTAKLGDDVLVGIWYTTTTAGTAGEAVVGPISFTQIATRPTGNGLQAATVVDASGNPVPDVGMTISNGTTVVGTTLAVDDTDSPIASNTGSFFLAPGKYTIQAAENDAYSAGAPVAVEIKAAGDVPPDLKVPIGKAK